MKKKKPEDALSQRVTNHLLMEYPKIPFRIDVFAGMHKEPYHYKILADAHGRWAKGFPDLQILCARGGYGGLFIELKATTEVADTSHTRGQKAYHRVLRHNGYKVDFACGFDEAKKQIKQYFKLKKNKVVK